MSEGKAQLNNLRVEQEIHGTPGMDVPVIADVVAPNVTPLTTAINAQVADTGSGNLTQGVIDGVNSYFYEVTSTPGNPNYLGYYWNSAFTNFTNDTAKAPLNSTVLTDLNTVNANINNATNLSLSQGTGGTDKITLTFNSISSISSYIDVFGNYGNGSVTPSGTAGGQGSQKPTSPSTAGMPTYEVFNFSASAGGGSLVDTYNPNTTVSEEISNYTGANGTGTNTSNLFNYTNGTSQLQTFTPLAYNVTELAFDYTGTNDTGTLDGSAFDFDDGSSMTLDAGTSSAPVYSDDSSTVDVALTSASGLKLGTLQFDTSTDADSLTLTNGLVIALPGVSDTTVHAADEGTTPLATLESYLGDLGYTGDLNAANGAYLDPASTSTYTVTGSSTTSGGVTYTSYELADNNAPGAIVDGTPANTNTLTAGDTDLTNDSISNIQTLQASGTLSLTGAEFGSFAQINGASTNLTTLSGTLTLTTSGIYSIAGSNVAGAFSLTAQAWGGTSLTGNGGDNETLTASLFGKDTLIAGNGTNDTLVAGEGVDSLTGGNGGNSGSTPSGTGDTFEASNGLAAGSSVTGNSGYDILIAEGDISGATVTGVPTLYTSGATLSAAEANQFTSVYGSGTIDITGGGTVALAGKTMSSGYIFDAVSNANTTLIGADTAANLYSFSTFAADGNGNDTLSAGDGAGDEMIPANDNYTRILSRNEAA